MVRHRHWYRPLTGDAQPRRIVCLETDTTLVEISGRPGIYLDQLVSWSAVAWMAEGARVLREFTATGTDGLSWWDRLDKFARTGVLTWVFGCHLKRSLTSLGIWNELELKRYLWTADPAATDAAGRQSSPSRRPTACCLAETPFLLDLRCRESGALIRIVDLGNYGIITPSDSKLAPSRVQSTAAAVRDLVRMVASNGWGPLKPTAASQAVTLWRKKHFTSPLLVHTIAPVLHLEKASYHGGRCEAYRLGKIPGPVYQLDVTSCYGAMARDAELPVAIAEWEADPQGRIDPHKVVERPCIADVLVRTEEPAYPCSVYLDSKRIPRVWQYWRSPSTPNPRPQCIWPVGTYRTCLSGPELLDAWLHRRIMRVWHYAYYLTAPALKSCMTDLLQVLRKCRAERNIACGTLVKSLIVGLVGKLGETSWRWEDDDSITPIGPWGEWWHTPRGGQPIHVRSLAWHTQRQVRDDYGDNAVYSCAAWITAAARMALLEYVRTAHWGNVYYVDTDCLFVNQAGLDLLVAAGVVRNGEPGLLTRKEDIQTLDLLGIKHYRADQRSVCAGRIPGIAGPAQRPGTAYLSEGADQSLKAGRPPDGRRVIIDISRGGPYLHGSVQSDNTVQPWRLSYG